MKLESLRNERTVSEEELDTAKKAAKEAAEQAEAAKNEVQAQIERLILTENQLDIDVGLCTGKIAGGRSSGRDG